jgi:hypothetical protein
MPKPMFKKKEPNYNNRDYLSETERKELDNFFLKQSIEQKTNCSVCKNSNLPQNMIPHHNCWKRS